MKHWLKWVIPWFLKRWDGYLLEHYPMVWRTRGMYVGWWALVLTPVFFVAGFFYPISANKLMVDPIRPLVLGDDNFYIGPLILLCPGILYWAYLQFQAGFPFAKSKTALATIFIYALCLFVISAVTTPAFRLGTLTRTGYFFLDKNAIRYWERNDFFLYGFILKESDSLYVSSYDTSTFFQGREAIFKELWRKEDQILIKRYDYDFMDSLFSTLFSLSSDPVRPRRVGEPYRSYLSYRSYLAYLSNGTDLLNRSDLLLLLPLSDLSDRSDELYTSNESDMSNELDMSDESSGSYLSDESDISEWVNKSDLAEESYRSYRLGTSILIRPSTEYRAYLSYQSDYSYYYKKHRRLQINKSLLEKYGIVFTYATKHGEDFISPEHILIMEDAIRSVRHARQYLNEWVIFSHWRVLFCFLLLLALLLFSAPFLSFRYALGALAMAIGGKTVSAGLSLDARFSEHWYYWNSTAYLILPLSGVLLLALAALRQKRYGWEPFAFHLLVVGMAAVLFFALFGGKWVFTTDEVFMGKPVDLAFFGAQVIGLAGVLLMAYVQALPKRA